MSVMCYLCDCKKNNTLPLKQLHLEVCAEIEKIPSGLFVHSSVIIKNNKKIKKLPRSLNPNTLIIVNSVVSQLPPEYNRLRRLDIKNSTNITELPLEYGATLLTLNLHNCVITEIPTEYVNLCMLQISNTPICELSPGYTELEELNCQNSLISCIPSTYESLEKLNCRGTTVDNIPSNFTNLTYLDCSYTRVSDLSPNFNELFVLKCDMCKIHCIPHYTDLKHLSIRNTLIHELPPMERLRKLYCSDTKITHVPDECQFLKELDVSNCIYCVSIPKKVYKRLIVDNAPIPKFNQDAYNKLQADTWREVHYTIKRSVLYDKNITSIITGYL